MKKLIICLFMTFSVHNIQAHPVPHYDDNPMPTCACKPYFNLKDKPITELYLSQWAELAATNFFSYGFGNYDAALKQASHFFTPHGWQQVQTDLEKSGNLEAVVENKLLVSASILEPPFLIRQVDEHQWLYQLKLKVIYENATDQLKQDLLINMRLKQFKPLNTLESVGIDGLSMQVL